MSSLRLQLRDDLKSRVKARALESGFDTVEAYIEALLLADTASGPVVKDDELESLLLNRIDGPFVDMDESDFKQLRQKLKSRLEDNA